MNAVEEFIKKESSAGIVLIFVTIIALLLKNTGLSEIYDAFLDTPVEIRFGALHIDKPLLLWINDGLMAVFFLLIGLEVKREIIEGHLSTPAQVVLPGFAAVGGMVVPAAVYLYFVGTDTGGTQGWAIPTATDIAFALGVLSLLGKRVPVSLKIFLMALAIIDDLGAIVIIALFYTAELSTLSIGVAMAALTGLVILNRLGVDRKAAYVILGVILWVSVLKSGVHATLAGVALAFTIPIKQRKVPVGYQERSMLKSMEHDLHYWVAFFILPLFAFVNAGVDFTSISADQILTPVPIGIAAGLFIGKQLGVFGFSWLAIRLGLAKLPDNSSMTQLYGVAILTGIGFTMSLFVNSLAFSEPAQFMFADKLAILVGSFGSGVLGYMVLRFAKHEHQSRQ
ncbi:MAG: Na(+)/H(+) antiporter NhaA [Gammaproteobacteria bacterium MedPE]|nr:MAG: Na(+)/H(+) antiporter NhaA [Gammaproteobacteria bacterium MedPE]